MLERGYNACNNHMDEDMITLAGGISYMQMHTYFHLLIYA